MPPRYAATGCAHRPLRRSCDAGFLPIVTAGDAECPGTSPLRASCRGIRWRSRATGRAPSRGCAASSSPSSGTITFDGRTGDLGVATVVDRHVRGVRDTGALVRALDLGVLFRRRCDRARGAGARAPRRARPGVTGVSRSSKNQREIAARRFSCHGMRPLRVRAHDQRLVVRRMSTSFQRSYSSTGWCTSMYSPPGRRTMRPDS